MNKMNFVAGIIVGAAILCAGDGALNVQPSRAADAVMDAPADSGPGVVQCANLIYGQDKSSVCFAEEFLALLQRVVAGSASQDSR